MDRQAGRSSKQVQIPGILKPNAHLLQHIGQFTAFFNISGKKSHQEVYNLIIETEKELRDREARTLFVGNVPLDWEKQQAG